MNSRQRRKLAAEKHNAQLIEDEAYRIKLAKLRAENKRKPSALLMTVLALSLNSE